MAETFRTIPNESILGVGASLWSETIGSIHDLEYLAFPRFAPVAEVGWSAAPGRSGWWDFQERLPAHGPRWSAVGVDELRLLRDPDSTRSDPIRSGWPRVPR